MHLPRVANANELRFQKGRPFALWPYHLRQQISWHTWIGCRDHALHRVVTRLEWDCVAITARCKFARLSEAACDTNTHPILQTERHVCIDRRSWTIPDCELKYTGPQSTPC
jgi:hypothetical protein